MNRDRYSINHQAALRTINPKNIDEKDMKFMQHTIYDKNTLKNLYTVGAIASLLQLATIIIYTLLMIILGPRVASAEEFYIIQQTNYWTSLFRVDLLLLILIGLYLGNFPALLVSLWRLNPLITMFAALFTLIAVTLSFAGESTFALFHLGKLHALATSDPERSQLIAAGEAILANGWWNSTGSFMTGLLLQGGGIMISAVMLRSTHFSKITALAGIIGNGFDLLQHILTPFMPGIAEYLSFAMLAYLVWYPMMARDLFALAKHPVSKHPDSVADRGSKD